jgi:molybdopterin-guanine dinucleotide biosynthesis protein A
MADVEKPVCDDVTVFVLTGGKSERMGSDKALLRLPSGETLMERALAVGASVARETRIVGAREKYAAYAWAGEIVEDLYPGQGPLAGIQVALKTSATEWNVVMAVDMPLVSGKLLAWLVERAKESGAVVTVPRAKAGRYETLCAVYRKEFCAVAEAALREARNKIDPLYALVNVRVLEPEEMAAAGFGAELFENCNTKEDLQRVLGVGARA